uniref:Uncharacterized protein n=1 Tax=Ananas comosus var. bracteatus TaxID=296719 RepID=A0A6V7PMA4_ANACO|nr:unnamed protein product [Ananas comosus var. bracteatus]
MAFSPSPPHLLPHPLPTSSFSSSPSHKPFSLLPHKRAHVNTFAAAAAGKGKKNPWLDPFDDGEDPDMEYTSLFADGKQEEDPRPPDNPDNPYGFLKFPQGYNVELDSLASKVRGDVRRCCCVISGGVYENLLFFPAIQLIRDRYPGVQVDVVAPRGGSKQPVLRYDLVDEAGGARPRGVSLHDLCKDKLSYVYPNVNAAGAGLLLTETFRSPGLNLSEGGYHMYHQMIEWLGRPARNVPRQPVPPLKVSISKKLRPMWKRSTLKRV